MWCITTYGYVSNDWYDRAEDAVNKPARALPSGAISPRAVLFLALGCALAGLIIAVSMGRTAFLAALAVLLLLTLYNVRMKATAGGGNLLIAVLSGCALLAGVEAAVGWQPAVFAAVFPAAVLLMLFVTAREIVKALQDVAGDMAAGKRTIAVRWGTHGTLTIVAALGGASVLVALWAVTTLGYSLAFGAIVLAGVVLPTFFSVVYLWRNSVPARVGHCLNLLKASYLFGLLTLIIA
jgi:4-hydroxybenzoate polyprenyltransferase